MTQVEVPAEIPLAERGVSRVARTRMSVFWRAERVPDVQSWDTGSGRFTSVAGDDVDELDETPAWWVGWAITAGLLGLMWLGSAVGYWVSGVPG